MYTFKESILSIGRNSTDLEEIADMIVNNQYYVIDDHIHSCRFRGTLINKSYDGLKIIGWERNITRVQDIDLSLPTIITLELDQDKTIKTVDLDSSFRGSQGLLCQRQYLLTNLRSNYINEKIDERFFRKINIGIVHCFHLVQVMAGIISCLQMLQENNLGFLLEEEAAGAYLTDNDFTLIGIQKMNFVNNPVSYAMVLRDCQDNLKFNENGTVYTESTVLSDFYINGMKLFTKELDGVDEKLLDYKLKSFSWEGLKEVKTFFTQDISNSFMCSNLFPSAFKGLFISQLLAQLFYNNARIINRYTKELRRSGDMPLCIGGIESSEEARKYFPNFPYDNLIPVG